MNKKIKSGNPFITSIFTADPSAHVFNDRVYVYASHDIDPARGADFMDKYHVFSSTDMVNWRDEGEILSSQDVAWGREDGGFMWAPDCAYKNGTYYFYYPHPSETKWNNTWKIGVATSKHPAKGFVDQGFIEGAGGFAMIDPAVFVEGDKTYFYYGGGGSHPLAGCFAAELNDDMMSFKTKLKKVRWLWDFHEAAWVFKRNDWYYLIYSDNKKNRNRYRYAMSKKPLGPWKNKGIFLDPVGCETTHGSIVEFKGQWYLFYHNQAISNQGNLRSICVDYIYFNEDGTIKKVEQTKEGVSIVGEPSISSNNITNYPISTFVDAEKLKNNKDYVVLTPNTMFKFDNLDGGKGGRAQIRFTYATDERLVKLKLLINNQEQVRINAFNDNKVHGFKDNCYITVKFKDGKNKVEIIEVDNSIKIKSVSVELLD